ncbi:MAG: DUF1800 family protein [Gammaproteobacteria bacterium]
MKCIAVLHAIALAATLSLTACIVDDRAEEQASVGAPAVGLAVMGRPEAIPVTERAAIRFLEQAAFGPTETEIQRVMMLGFEGYIDEQFGAAGSTYAASDANDRNTVKQQFLNNAVRGGDQLRQRMGFALGQIFVVSFLGVSNAEAIAGYQNMLLRNAFGTYDQLLREVTLHPTMGSYLDLVHTLAGPHPNENYARELMQLFSIGTVVLELDGSPRHDARNESIPAYTQKDVEELARALSGWTYPTLPGQTPAPRNPTNFIGPLEPVETLHDAGTKVLLGGTLLPAGQTAEADLTAALAAVSSHPNVAPFISIRLIQHFVTSNPSGEYVRRVAQVFNHDADGVRGNLKAVIKAILLDPEARRGDDPTLARDHNGRLKDPILFMTGLLRALDATGDLSNEIYRATGMGQNIFTPPSVFNFYSPDHPMPGAEMTAPEFQIFTSPNLLARYNFVSMLVYGSSPSVAVDLSPWLRQAETASTLMAAIDRLLFHDAMSATTRAAITQAVEQLPPDNALTRVRAALYLAATTPEYQIHH